MKKFMIFGILAGFCATASASDYIVREDSVATTHVRANYDIVTYVEDSYVAPVRRVTPAKRPCARTAAATPVKVKTHTEVIDHYQVYQPVTVYAPVGTYSQRRVVEKPSCGECGY